MDELPFCLCGCGLRVAKKGNKYVAQHHLRNKKRSLESRLLQIQTIKENKLSPKPKPIALFCECGCGELTKPGNRFINGHGRRIIKPKSEPKLCECGCGGLASPGKRFIHGHNKPTLGKFKPKPKLKLCACGCGGYANSGYDYILGHSLKGKERTLAHCMAISKANKGVPRSEASKIATSKTLKGKYCGEDNAAWKGGMTVKSYCDKFDDGCREHNRNKYDNCDFISGLPDYICNLMKNGRARKLDVHHVDYNRIQGCDGIKWKLIPLSRINHIRTNRNRTFWERLFCYALEYDRDYYKVERINKERIEWK